MKSANRFQKIYSFFATKIAIGIFALVVPVWMIEWVGQNYLGKLNLPEDLQNGIISIAVSAAAVYTYLLIFRLLEKRKTNALDPSAFLENAGLGFLTGLILQCLFILILYLKGYYQILVIHPASYLLPSLIFALTAGFVAELIIRGVIFRIIEERFGTTISIVFMILLFGVFHFNSKGSTVISLAATCIASGFLPSAAYVFSRSLWVPIFLHFAWDFAEPGIFGGINPGISAGKSLITAQITGPVILTGGETGPQNSLQALILCLATGVFFLWLAHKKNRMIPFPQRQT